MRQSIYACSASAWGCGSERSESFQRCADAFHLLWELFPIRKIQTSESCLATCVHHSRARLSKQLLKFFQSSRFAALELSLRIQQGGIKMLLKFFPALNLSCFPAVLFINLLFICTENSPLVSLSLSVIRSLLLLSLPLWCYCNI